MKTIERWLVMMAATCWVLALMHAQAAHAAPPQTAAAVAAAAAPEAGAKPNVLFLLVDDLDVAVYQSGLDAGLYPHLKSLMAAGTTFTNSFVSLSICCPSRSTFLTGQYAHNHGTVRNVGKAGGFKSFRDASTLPVWLRAGGYRTALMGKYLNGYKTDDSGYVPPGWDTWNALLSLHQYDYSLTVPGGVQTHGSAPEDYQTDVLAGMAESYVRTPSSQPFFLALTPSAPHLESAGEVNDDDGGTGIRPAPRHVGTPVVPLPAAGGLSFNEADLSDKPRWLRNKPLTLLDTQERVFNEKRTAMRAVDDMVGRLVQALKEVGKWNNTLFVFASDNGFQYGTHRRNLTKVDFYEESLRVPLVVKAPGQRSGSVSAGWAVNNDWAVTVLDYAGVPAGAGHVVDGQSLRPVLAGTDAGRRTMMIELPPTGQDSGHPPFYALRTRDPALTLDASGKKVLVFAETLNTAGNSTSDYELYDLDIDPLQLQSLHSSRQALRVQQMQLLRTRLDALKSCVGDRCAALER